MQIPPEILNITPYKPGKPIEETKRQYRLEKVYKLASNENLLGPNPKVKEAIVKGLTQIHRYPDGSCYILKQALYQHFSIHEDHIALGNGSDDLIVLLIRGFCLPKNAILVSKGSFLLYQIFAQGCHIPVTAVPLNTNYSIDLEGLMRAWQPHHRLVFLPNPNNPTGSYISSQRVKAFLDFFKDKDNTLVVIDEAYNGFITQEDSSQTLEFLSQYPNLVILRTFSKDYGLAGLRIGFLFGSKLVVNVLNRLRTPFNVNSLAQIAAVTALEDQDYISKACQTNLEGLQYFSEQLKEMGLPFCPSQTNFIFFDSLRDSSLVFEALLKKGLILRPLKPYGFTSHFRMTVGCMEDNKMAINILKSVLPSIPILKPS